MMRMVGGLTDFGFRASTGSRAVHADARAPRVCEHRDPAPAVYILAAIGILVSCGEGGPAEPPPPPPVAAVSLTPEAHSLAAIDETIQFSATPRDVQGSPLTGRSISWISSDPAVATVSTSGLATGVANGTATISASVDGVAGTTTLTVSQVGVTMRIAAQPADAAVGVPFGAQPVVEILDANGYVVQNDDASVITASIASGSGVLLGMTSVTVQAGVAMFTDLAVDGLIGDRILEFATGELAPAVSSPFALEAGPAVTIEIVTQPADARAGVPLVTQPVVRLLDANGNVTENDNASVLTVSIAAGGGTLTGRTDVTVKSGVATFADLAVEGVAGERTLRFAADRLAPAVSEAFALLHGLAATLSLVTQPEGARAGLPLDTQPVVQILDASGNIVLDDDTSIVTASVASGGGSLTGATEATAAKGEVTFTGLAVTGAVGERTLEFASGELVPDVSEALTVLAGPPATLSLESGDGQEALADTDLPEPLAVIVEDAFGNAVADASVSWAVSEGSGSLSADDTTTDEEGVSSVTYRLGRFAGIETVEAAADSLDGSSVSFVLSARPNGRITGSITLGNQLLAASKDATAIGPRMTRPAGLGGRRVPPTLGPLGRSGPSRSSADSRSVAQQGPEYVPGELLVTYRAAALRVPSVGASAYRVPATAQAVATTLRAALAPHERAGAISVLGVSPAILAARVRVEDLRGLAFAEQTLRADPAIASVERHPIAYSFTKLARTGPRLGTSHAASILPSDPFFPLQAWHYKMIDLPRAWDITTGNSAVVVAVLDDGIRFDHPDIAANLTSDGYDFVADDALIPICAGGTIDRAGDGDGYDPDPTIPTAVIMNPTLNCIVGEEEFGGHGLHVAGTIGAAGNDDLGVTGVNWNVAIRPVRVIGIDAGHLYDVAQGILYAAGIPVGDGVAGIITPPPAARIINMSLGAAVDALVMFNAVSAAADAGVLIIASAGNETSSVPNYPASYPQVLSVSAVAPDGSLASYSSFGPTVDIAAPGGELSAGCDFAVLSTTWNFASNTPNHFCNQGTSMAAPHVSGVAALLLANQPGLSASQLRSRLIDYAVPAGPPDQFGAGIVSARNSLTQSLDRKSVV